MILFIHSIPLWIELTSLSFCTGALVVFLRVSPVRNPDAPERHHDRLWFAFGVALAVALTSSAVDFLSRTVEMSGAEVLDVFPLVPMVLIKTHAGRVWLLRMSCLIIVLVLMKTARARRQSQPFLYMLSCIFAVIALTESASGHAADKGDFSIAELVDWVHLLGAMVWAGGLFALSAVILPLQRAGHEQSVQTLAEIATRFSRVAGSAVGCICLTSLYNVSVYVGSSDALIRSAYGRTVIVKVILFAVLLVFGSFNRYISVPRLMHRTGSVPPAPTAFGRLATPVFRPFARSLYGDRLTRWFGCTVRVEALLISGILLCAALLRHEVPARHALHVGPGGHPGMHHEMQHEK